MHSGIKGPKRGRHGQKKKFNSVIKRRAKRTYRGAAKRTFGTHLAVSCKATPTICIWLPFQGCNNAGDKIVLEKSDENLVLLFFTKLRNMTGIKDKPKGSGFLAQAMMMA